MWVTHDCVTSVGLCDAAQYHIDRKIEISYLWKPTLTLKKTFRLFVLVSYQQDAVQPTNALFRVTFISLLMTGK